MTTWNIMGDLCTPCGIRYKRRKRRCNDFTNHNEGFHISDSSDSENSFPLKNSKFSINNSFSISKRIKLNISKHGLSEKYRYVKGNPDDEGTIVFDPDVSEVCNGCSPCKIRKPLSLYNIKDETNNIQEIKDKSYERTLAEKIDGSDSSSDNVENGSTSKEAIIECTSSQSSDKLFYSLHTATTNESSRITRDVKDNDLNYLILELQKERRRMKRIQPKKGGYLQKMRKAVQKFKSEQAFWEHERRIGLQERGSRAIIKNKAIYYGIHIFTLGVESDFNKERTILLSQASKMEKYLSIGSRVEINNCYNSYGVHDKIIYAAGSHILK